MTTAELDLLRSLIGSLIHTASAIDQLLNPEPDEEPDRKPPPRTMGDDPTTPGVSR